MDRSGNWRFTTILFPLFRYPNKNFSIARLSLLRAKAGDHGGCYLLGRAGGLNFFDLPPCRLLGGDAVFGCG
ncbi:MAG: hypothetical protein CM15mP46_3280 [Alphaproteobacteria bacterium]|nr:MAG: hypothetical protein CM15mP46_3280 [Alphaproteobacteria bacterium]